MLDKKIIDEITVKHIARLSRLNLSDKEITLYRKQLGDILEYINKLKEVDTKDTPPTSHPQEGLKNVFRKDAVKKSLATEDVLENAPRKKDNLFSVPRIIE